MNFSAGSCTNLISYDPAVTKETENPNIKCLGNTFHEACPCNALNLIMNIYKTLKHTMNTLTMHYMWLWLQIGFTLNSLVTMIIQHYRCIIMHYKYVHNAYK